MAKLSVRELRKEKRRKKYGNSLFFEIRCNFKKPALNRKRFAKKPTKIQVSADDHCSQFTGLLFSLQSPSSARDEKNRGEFIDRQRKRVGEEELALAVARSPRFSKRTKRKIKQRLCKGYDHCDSYPL